MIDIHSHILHGLDDGSKSLEESVAMLAVASAAGTTDIVATPHADLQYSFNPELIAQRVQELRAAAPSGAPNIYTGCDFHLQYDNIQDAIANPRKYTINQRSYLLVEFSDLLVFHNTSEILDHLLDAGMIPVITHPERNELLRQRLENMKAWVGAGCCVQITGQSLLGHFGREAKAFSETLLDANLVHFIASDAHDVKHRPPKLDDAYPLVEKKYGARRAVLLFIENPRAALVGEPLAAAEPGEGRSRKWFQFW